MQIKNKLFPYPIINHNKILSSFGNRSFDLIFEPSETDAEYVMKNARFFTESELINRLFSENKIKIYCIIECSYTVYRKAFELNREGVNIILPKVDFTERVDISMFAVANEDFILSSNEVDEDYLGIEFEIEKYDIIGANDGVNVRFQHDESEGNLAQSIFSIIISNDFVPGAYSVECSGRKIVVTLAEQDYNNYKIIYAVTTYKEVFFNMLLVPALIEGLTLCKTYLTEDSSRDLDDVGNQYLWFRSILNAYKRLKGVELTVEELMKISPSFLAQELLGKPLGESLKNLVETMTKTEDGENE